MARLGLWTDHVLSAPSLVNRSRMRAELHLLSTGEGGRSQPMLPGYRSLIRFEGSDMDFGFQVASGFEALEPGGSANADLVFWAEGALADVSAGRRFELREGTRVIGHGTVLGCEYDGHETPSPDSRL